MAEDILDSIGGSLLNDLLTDLNAVVTVDNAKPDDSDRGDDLFALLEQELTTTYADPPPLPTAPPGMQQISPAAFVVNQQAIHSSSSGNAGDDAWSAAISQFGSMSLAADFLAADTAKKQEEEDAKKSTQSELGEKTSKIVDKLFKEDEDYALDEEVIFEGQQRKGFDSMEALLGVPRAKKSDPAEGNLPQLISGGHSPAESKTDPSKYGASPPGPLLSPPYAGGYPTSSMPPPRPGNGMMPLPPMNPELIPSAQQGITFPSGMGNGNGTFVAPGRNPQHSGQNQELMEVKAAIVPGGGETNTNSAAATLAKVKLLFNNPNPNAPPIASRNITGKLMPSRDISYVVHSMLRPLQSLDYYNDDFYHWSTVNRGSGVLSAVQRMGTYVHVAQPDPVSKGTKAIAKEHEEKFHESFKARAKVFAEEKKSLGQLVKTNVKRPKALLSTPVLNKDNAEDPIPDAGKSDSKYESEERRSRIHLWKARVSIDRGYSAFLSLIELRRLIQANGGAPGIINELMADVKTNVDQMHSSLGITIKVDAKGKKKIEIDRARLDSALSLPKGRVLCARVIEEGILPHPSACRLLPVALCCIFLLPMPAPEGEERLLHALTVLVQTPQPCVDPLILDSCLDALILGMRDGRHDVYAVTGSHMRMKLLHSILTVGKAACTGSLKGEWSEKEKAFMEILNAQKKE